MFDKKIKIDNETAENEFNIFCENWEIEFDTSKFDEDDIKGFEDNKNRIVKAIQKGRLIVDGDNLIYTVEKSDKIEDKKITIKRPDGAALMSMDRAKDSESMKKLFILLGNMTEKNSQFFARLDGIDLKVFTAIATLFLNS